MSAVEIMSINSASKSDRGECETCESSSISALPRRTVPCAAENKAMYSMLLSVSKAQKCRIEQDRVDEKGNNARGGLKVHNKKYLAYGEKRDRLHCGALLVGCDDARS